MYIHFIEAELPSIALDFNAAAGLRSTPPIIAGNNNSVVVGNSATKTVSVKELAQGAEGSSFSIEAWVLPVSGDVYVFDHDNASLRYNDAIIFTVSVNGQDVSVSYVPPVKKAIHVVGTYTKYGLALYVDGLWVADAQFETPNVSGWVVDADATIGAGTGVAIVDGIALYGVELSASSILNHYGLGRSIPAITTNLSDLSATIANFENQDQFLITRAVWPSWENPGKMVNVGVVDGSLYSESGGTWQTFIPLPNYDVVQKAKISWAGSGVAVAASYDGEQTWLNVTNGSVPGITGTSPFAVSIMVTFAAGATLENITVELYDSLNYSLGLTEATATYDNGDIVNADQDYDQLDYRVDRGFYTAGTAGVDITYDPAIETEPIHAVDVWFRTETTTGTIVSVSGATASSVSLGSGGTTNASDELYVNGTLVTSFPMTFRPGEWTHILLKLATPRVANLELATNGFSGNIGSATIFKESTSGQEQRIYRSYFGGQRLDLSDDAGLTVAEGGWDLYSYDWTAVGS